MHTSRLTTPASQPNWNTKGVQKGAARQRRRVSGCVSVSVSVSVSLSLSEIRQTDGDWHMDITGKQWANTCVCSSSFPHPSVAQKQPRTTFLTTKKALLNDVDKHRNGYSSQPHLGNLTYLPLTPLRGLEHALLFFYATHLSTSLPISLPAAAPTRYPN